MRTTSLHHPIRCNPSSPKHKLKAANAFSYMMINGKPGTEQPFMYRPFPIECITAAQIPNFRRSHFKALSLDKGLLFSDVSRIFQFVNLHCTCLPGLLLDQLRIRLLFANLKAADSEPIDCGKHCDRNRSPAGKDI
jgi:hypothetical protein